MSNKFYLPISGDNLGVYFSKALIVPQVFFNDPIIDLQSKCRSCLVLSENKYLENANCVVEIVLTDDELNALLPSTNQLFKLYPKPLPISRVSKIYFYSKEKLERVIGEANTASYIPARLLDIYNNSADEKSFDETFEIVIQNEKRITETNKKLIDRYNSFLGAIAFMRMVKMNLGNGNFSNFSQSYFSTLAFFNKRIEAEVSPFIDKYQLKTSFQSLFNSEDPSRAEVKHIIYGSDKDIHDVLNGEVEYRNNAFKQDSVIGNWKLYLYSILANHGHDYNKVYRTDRLINTVVNNPNEHTELVTLAYGLRNGYEGFQKLYLLDEKLHSYKFELNSVLDYYTIESIYNKVFNDLTGSDYPYLKDILPENYRKTLKVDFTKYNTYDILDETVIISVKPETFKSKVASSFSSFFGKKFFSLLAIDFSKKNEIKLTEDQVNQLSEGYYSILKAPLNDFIQQLGNELQEHHENVLKEAHSSIEQVEASTISSQANSSGISKEELLKTHEMYLRLISKTELYKQAEKYSKVGKKAPKTQSEVDSLVKVILDKISSQY